MTESSLTGTCQGVEGPMRLTVGEGLLTEVRAESIEANGLALVLAVLSEESTASRSDGTCLMPGRGGGTKVLSKTAVIRSSKFGKVAW